MEKTRQQLLTPSPKELNKSLAKSAKQARALAAAFGAKIPYEPAIKASKVRSSVPRTGKVK